MRLIQLLVPLNDNDNNRFPKEVFIGIKEQLLDKFKGVTAFSQSPAEGLWNDGTDVQKDQIILYEIMTEDINKEWWESFVRDLEHNLKQEKILLRWSEIFTL